MESNLDTVNGPARVRLRRRTSWRRSSRRPPMWRRSAASSKPCPGPRPGTADPPQRQKIAKSTIPTGKQVLMEFGRGGFSKPYRVFEGRRALTPPGRMGSSHLVALKAASCEPRGRWWVSLISPTTSWEPAFTPPFHPPTQN